MSVAPRDTNRQHRVCRTPAREHFLVVKRDVTKTLAYAIVALTAVTTYFVTVEPENVSAHAPIEWSDPPNDAVVERVPESISVRFAEEPLSVTMRTIEPEPRKGVEVTPERTGERTYRVRIPEGTITPDDNTMVLFIETKARDGHTASGVYLLHVKTKKDDTAKSETTATTTTAVQVETTLSTSVPGETNTDPTRGEFVPPKRKDSGVQKQAAAATLILIILLGTVGIRKNKKQNTKQRRSRK